MSQRTPRISIIRAFAVYSLVNGPPIRLNWARQGKKQVFSVFFFIYEYPETSLASQVEVPWIEQFFSFLCSDI